MASLWCLQPWRKFPQLPSHLAGALRLVNGFPSCISWVSFKPLIFLLCPRVGESILALLGYSRLQGGALGCGAHSAMASAVLHVSVWSLVCRAEAVQLALGSSSGGIALSVGVNSVCSWEEVSLVSSYTAILDRKPVLVDLILFLNM